MKFIEVIMLRSVVTKVVKFYFMVLKMWSKASLGILRGRATNESNDAN